MKKEKTNIIKHPSCEKYKQMKKRSVEKVLDETRKLNPKQLITISELPFGKVHYDYTYSNRSKVIACLEKIKFEMLANNDINEILNGKNYQQPK